MTAPLEASVVRIRTADGNVVGAGFLVDERQVLTCAHVVLSALGLRDYPAEAPTDEVHLDFPFVAREHFLTAQVVVWKPLRPNGLDDIAGLELHGDLPQGVKPVALIKADDLSKHLFRVLGFPSGYNDGIWVNGEMIGRQATGWVQIEGDTAYRIKLGFSGAPVWDETLKGVVGMVVAAEKREEIKAAFIIPTDKLVETWPALGEEISPPPPSHVIEPAAAALGRGGVSIEGARDVHVRDVIGRDQVIQNIQNIYQRALTAAEAIEKDESIGAGRLEGGVVALLQRLQAVASDTSDTATGNPYKGLLEYRLSDAEIFFGRARAIREFMPKLQRSRLTVLHAESGAGKSSLLQAGIAPRLIAAGHLPVYLRPYNKEPSLRIKREFLTGLGLTPLLEKAPLRGFLRQVCNSLGAQTELHIFLDQFEEFWVKSGPTQLEETERTRFISELAECLDDASLNVRWVLSLRTESFGNLADFRPYIHRPFENEYRLKRLDLAEAREAIIEPANLRGLTFEEGLLERVLDDLGGKEIAPPQMQLVCSALYEALKPGEPAITRTVYDREGGAAGILGNHLERVLSRDLQANQRAAARRLLESLITSEAQRVIRTHTELVAELSARGVTPETLDVILDQLVDSRLLRVEEGGPEGAELSYELAHEYLLTEIKLDPQTQKRKAAQELLEQEVRAYRRHGTLLSADRLAVIEPFRAELYFTPAAERLYAESLTNIQWQRARRRRLAFGVITLALTLLLALYAFSTTASGFDPTAYAFGRAMVNGENPFVPLSGGTMIFGSTEPDLETGEQRSQTVNVDEFAIQQTEATNRQFRLCRQARWCRSDPMIIKYYDDQGYDDYPVVYVTASQASEFCRWVGGDLPDSYQWERAARGLNGRSWPWGEEPPTPDRANLYPSAGITETKAYPSGAAVEGGVLNLVGNVWEWTRTRMQQAPDGSYSLHLWDGREAEVALASRGGSWGFAMTRITEVQIALPEEFNEYLGFRCVKPSK